MKVGMVGCGKLGLPCAVAMDLLGHDVMGYDIDRKVMSLRPKPYREAGPDGTGDFNMYLSESKVAFGEMWEVCERSEILFVAVQTPHDKKFEGVTPLPIERQDFDYRHLRVAMISLNTCIRKPTVVVIISTVLPGTIRREILPLLTNPHIELVYNPFFIAMGTTMRDLLQPEFVLLGSDSFLSSEDRDAFKDHPLHEFYSLLLRKPWRWAIGTIENAELTKVAYNTFISLKIAFANTLMEICHKIPGCHVDDVSDALALGDKRITSPAYMRGGMGDGGGCHPRDNIALSWLAKEHDLSYDLFGEMMWCRERQAQWLATMMREHDLPLAICGYTFKPETDLTVGSPALLVLALLADCDHVAMYDPYVDGLHPNELFRKPHCYLIGTKHERFREYVWPSGSVVIDPFRYLKEQPGVKLISVGVGSKVLTEAPEPV